MIETEQYCQNLILKNPHQQKWEDCNLQRPIATTNLKFETGFLRFLGLQTLQMKSGRNELSLL